MINLQPSRRIEIHQLEGLDTRNRVFNRNVNLVREEGRYISTFSYEGSLLSSGSQPTIKEALGDLVRKLHQAGFKQLQSRLNFRGKRYFAESEPWVIYDDKTPVP